MDIKDLISLFIRARICSGKTFPSSLSLRSAMFTSFLKFFTPDVVLYLQGPIDPLQRNYAPDTKGSILNCMKYPLVASAVELGGKRSQSYSKLHLAGYSSQEIICHCALVIILPSWKCPSTLPMLGAGETGTSYSSSTPPRESLMPEDSQMGRLGSFYPHLHNGCCSERQKQSSVLSLMFSF